jgi:hypothetical protein
MSCIALVAIIYGIVLVGTPSEQRAKRMDSQRINDLRNIQNEVVYTHWQNKGDIPSKLEEMNDPISGFIVPTDPETKENYTYKNFQKIVLNSVQHSERAHQRQLIRLVAKKHPKHIHMEQD